MYKGRPVERKNGSTSSRIASWDCYGNVIAISISYYKVVTGRIWSCLPFDRKIWLTSRRSIMVSYLKHQSAEELSLPLRFDFKKCVNFRSASLEPRNLLVRFSQNEETTSKHTRACCLSFTWANQSVHGLGKWYAKFRTGKFRPGIAFTVCINQFHFPKNDREGLKLVSNMALRKWNTNFL